MVEMDRILSRIDFSGSGLYWLTSRDGPVAIGILFRASRKFAGRMLVLRSEFRRDAGAAVYRAME